MPVMKTKAPSLTKSFAAAKPIPSVPPVITATFPFNLPSVVPTIVCTILFVLRPVVLGTEPISGGNPDSVLARLLFVQPGANVGDGVAIEAFIETARNIADMRCGKQILGTSVRVF